MVKATLIVMRHGQTEHNKHFLMTGQDDVPLTKDGEEQARQSGMLIGSIHIDKVYSSTLSRAFNTAALAVEAAGTETHLLNDDGTWQIEKRSELVEMHTGDFTGRCHKTDPEVQAWKREYRKPLPNGESEAQVTARVKKFYDTEVLPRLMRGENVMIVAHSGVMRIFGIVVGIESEPATTVWSPSIKVENAAPVVYAYEDGKIVSLRTIENPKKAPRCKPNKLKP